MSYFCLACLFGCIHSVHLHPNNSQENCHINPHRIWSISSSLSWLSRLDYHRQFTMFEFRIDAVDRAVIFFYIIIIFNGPLEQALLQAVQDLFHNVTFKLANSKWCLYVWLKMIMLLFQCFYLVQVVKKRFPLSRADQLCEIMWALWAGHQHSQSSHVSLMTRLRLLMKILI